MLFSIVKRNNPYVVLVFPLFVIGLWITFLLNPEHISFYYDESPMPLYKLLLSTGEKGSLTYAIINFCWIGINALIFSRINSVHRLIDKGTSAYLYIFAIITINFPGLQQLNPLQPSLTFVMLGILSIYKMYKNERGLKAVFEAGASFGIASLFYANSIFISIFIFAALFSLVPLNWRQWTSGLFGILTPIAFLFSVSYLNDSIPELIGILKENILIKETPKGLNIPQQFFAGILGVLFLTSIVNSYSFILRKVSAKKYYGLFLILVIITISTYFAVPTAGTEVIYFATIPLVFYITNYMVHMRSRIISELFFLLLLAATVFVQLYK